MDTITYEFNEHKIEFQLNGDRDVKVNATQMAKIFDKRIDRFLRTDNTKSFIDALLFTLNGGNKKSEFTPKRVNSEEIKREDIIQTKGHAGTFMHRSLSLKFAAWLNPHFEVWIYMTIEKLIFGHFAEQKQRLENKAKRMNRLAELEMNLIDNSDFKEYQKLEKENKKDGYLNRSENAQQLNLMRDLFK